MPKKQPRNSFYFYMMDYKEEQRKKGINYANMQEVAAAAGSSWTQVSPQVRAKYEAMAKAEKAKRNVPEKKFTSTGVSLAAIEALEKERRDAEAAERQDITNFVKVKSVNGTIANQDIYLMDVNCYCRANGEYLVGELTLLRFRLQEGIKDTYHLPINPGGIPMGYAFDVKLGGEELGLPMPEEGPTRTNLMQLLANVVDYLKQRDPTVRTLPPIFTVPDKVAPVADFIQQMCAKAAEDERLFRVYKLDTLLFTLASYLRTRDDDGFPKESLAAAQLRKDPFKYTPKLACERHEASDKAVECTQSRVKRWAFTVLDSCCPLLGVAALPGHHAPFDFDIDSILMFKEQRQQGTSRVAVPAAARSADTSVAASANSSVWADTSRDTLHDSADITLGSHSAPPPTGTKEKKPAPPLRMPDTDYSQRIQPPQLSDDAQFPMLGRGRGLSSSFNNMNVNK